MAYTLVESYLYACPKVGYARIRSRTACFNEGFLKQAILSSKQLAEERVDSSPYDGRPAWASNCVPGKWTVAAETSGLAQTQATDERRHIPRKTGRGLAA